MSGPGRVGPGRPRVPFEAQTARWLSYLSLSLHMYICICIHIFINICMYIYIYTRDCIHILLSACRREGGPLETALGSRKPPIRHAVDPPVSQVPQGREAGAKASHRESYYSGSSQKCFIRDNIKSFIWKTSVNGFWSSALRKALESFSLGPATRSRTPVRAPPLAPLIIKSLI